MTPPRITFGIIVLNGEPFTRYTLRALYPYAHQIIVVEGAAPAAANVATPDGHSIDGTLEVLYRFKAEEDPEDKLHIITRNGFWTEKDEMSQAYADHATGDYLWQVDVDEFYKDDDMHFVLKMLHDEPDITAVTFKTITFWGAPDYTVDGWYLRRGAAMFHRLFKWEPGYKYLTHRPPTVIDDQGRDLRTLKWVKGEQLAKKGIVMYHYSLLFPKQVLGKSEYYGNAFANVSGGTDWATRNYIRLQQPFRVYNVYKYPSWLDDYTGEHPGQFQALWTAVCSGELKIDIRQNHDVKTLLRSPGYKIRRFTLKRLDYWSRMKRLFFKSISPVVKQVRKVLKAGHSVEV